MPLPNLTYREVFRIERSYCFSLANCDQRLDFFNVVYRILKKRKKKNRKSNMFITNYIIIIIIIIINKVL